jgi:serine acetyltransferase
MSRWKDRYRFVTFLEATARFSAHLTIEDRIIVCAGAVVTRDGSANSVAVDAPARRVCNLVHHVERLKTLNKDLPWRENYLRTIGQCRA